MSNPRYTDGTTPKKPKNVGQYDKIECRAYIQVGPGPIRIRCKGKMNLKRLLEIVPIGNVYCGSVCCQRIHPRTQYVAVCDNVRQHLDSKKRIICTNCIENDTHYGNRVGKMYQIIKDVYQYKPKKK